MSGADLANLVNEAALIAGKRGQPALTPDMLDEAMDKAVMGGERKCFPFGFRCMPCVGMRLIEQQLLISRGLSESVDLRKKKMPANNATSAVLQSTISSFGAQNQGEAVIHSRCVAIHKALTQSMPPVPGWCGRWRRGG